MVVSPPGPGNQVRMAPVLVVVDSSGKVISSSPGIQEVFGYDPEELRQRSIRTLLTKPYAEQEKMFVVQYLDAEHTSSSRVVEGLHKDGSVFPVILSPAKVNRDSSSVRTVLLERAQEKRASFLCDEHGKTTSVDEKVATLLGYHDSRELVGKYITLWLPRHLRTKIQTYFKDTNHTSYAMEFMHTDGDLRPMIMQIDRSHAPHVYDVSLWPLDVLEGVITFDCRGNVKSCNEMYLTMFGYNREDVENANLNQLGIPLPGFVNELENIRAGTDAKERGSGPTMFQENRVLELCHRDSTPFTVNFNCSEIEDDCAGSSTSEGGGGSELLITGIISMYAPDSEEEELMSEDTACSSAGPTPRPLTSDNGELYISYYLVGKTIGEGTFGVVKQGTHRITGEPVAIKVLDNDLMRRVTSHSGMDCTAREIEVLKLCNHPNIIKLIEVVTAEKFTYIVMELGMGYHLKEYIERKGMEEAQARLLFRQLVDAVEYLHNVVKVVHRDIKLENMLLDEAKGRLKLIDFGECEFYDYNRKLTAMCGNPIYAAPEMLAGEGYIGPEVDIWSLGCVLYSLVTGWLPFATCSDAENLCFRFDRTHVSFSYELEDLLGKLLVKDPSCRLTITEVSQHPWVNQGFEARPYTAPAPSPPPVDSEIMKQLQHFGFDDHLTQLVSPSHFDSVSATYRLLEIKRERENATSMKRVITAPGRLMDMAHQTNTATTVVAESSHV
eukprot:GFYU01007699.1.p1 GENE.GFYU01007699.1~~GFYU01007699.1.p1  ORF type:complete len:724 (+),score=146.70 GFYU01007699.1:382-2553(+)